MNNAMNVTATNDHSELALRTCRAVANVLHVPVEVNPRHRLVRDLGFDSLRMATLGLSLEDAFGCTILLSDWIASVDDPATLTVESLMCFIADRLSLGRAA